MFQPIYLRYENRIISLSFLEKGYVILSLLFFSQAFISFWQPERYADQDLAQGDLTSQLIFLCIYSIAIILLIARFQTTIRAIKKSGLLWVFIGFITLSILWSAFPVISFRRVIAFIGTSIFGLYLGTRFSLEKIFYLLIWTFGIAITLSFVVAVLSPSQAITQSIAHQGAWSGIFSQKNILGRVASISAILFLIAALNRKMVWLNLLLFCASWVLLILSDSSTSLVVTIILVMAVPLFRLLQRSFSNIFGLLLASIPLTINVIVIFYISGVLFDINETLLDFLGKDATLTGRTALWSLSLEKVQERFLFGYGYNGFWLGFDSPAEQIWNIFWWHPTHAHNGFIDILLDLGIIGFALFAVLFLKNYWNSWVWLRSSDKIINLWPILIITAMLLFSVTQSVLLERNSTFWVLFTAIFISFRTFRSHQLDNNLT